MILWVYDRWGNQINCIGDFSNLIFDDELGSLDYIEFNVIGEILDKGNYLVWKDEFGKWHEHIVRSVTRTHGKGTVICSIYAVNSISELNLSYKNERDSYDNPNSEALRRLIEDTRWAVGTVDNLGANDIKFYHETVYEGIVDIVDKWGGEISTSINVGTKGIIERKINHQKVRGEDNGLLFTYGFDADDIERKIELDDVYTRLHVFGKGEANYSEGSNDPKYGRRITFADINDGKDYVEDDEAKELWGVMGKDGIRQHAEGSYIANDCEDKAELLEIGKAKLDELKHPRVSYSANVAILADAGMEFKNAQTGDVCYIRDKEINERLSGRILHVKRYLSGDKPTEITLGNIKRTIRQTFEEYKKELDSLSSSAANWDGIVTADANWLSNMMSNLNEVMNAAGGYTYWTQGEGITVYDKPIDQNPTMAIQLSGAGFRIANSKKSNGEWDWRTFGTGDGFTADVINAGMLRGGNTTFDLESGVLNVYGTIEEKQFNVVLDATRGLSIYSDGKRIGGLEVVDGEVSLVADVLRKANYNSYITTGAMAGGSIYAMEYMSTDFNSRSGNWKGGMGSAFSVIPLYATDDGRLNGHGLSRNRILSSYATDKGARYGFKGTEVDPNEVKTLTVDAPFVWLDNDGGGIYYSDVRCMMFDNTNAYIGYDSDHKMWLDSEGFFVDVFKKGIAYRNGEFYTNMTYAS